MIVTFRPSARVLTPYPIVIGDRTVLLQRGRNDLGDVSPADLAAALRRTGLEGAVRPVEAPVAPAPVVPHPEPVDAPTDPAAGKPARPRRGRGE